MQPGIMGMVFPIERWVVDADTRIDANSGFTLPETGAEPPVLGGRASPACTDSCGVSEEFGLAWTLALPGLGLGSLWG